jgi:hypothetical protein
VHFSVFGGGADPQELPAGLALVNGQPLVGDGLMRMGIGDLDFTTRLELGTDAGAPRALLDGMFVLYDSRRGIGTLMGTADPVPNLFILRDEALLRLIR